MAQGLSQCEPRAHERKLPYRSIGGDRSLIILAFTGNHLYPKTAEPYVEKNATVQIIIRRIAV